MDPGFLLVFSNYGLYDCGPGDLKNFYELKRAEIEQARFLDSYFTLYYPGPGVFGILVDSLY